MNKYDLSIVITTFNRKHLLIEAIKSIKKQNYKNYEIIIIDDHSNDGTKDLFENNREIKYIYCNKHNGPSLNRKKGLELSQGEFIVFMDDDDFYVKDNFFENAITILKNDTDISFISANAYIYIDETKKIKQAELLEFSGKIRSIEFLELFQTKTPKPYSTFTTVFRKSYILNNGISNIEMFNDSSIYINVLFYSKYVFFMKDIVGCYRVHVNNISKNIRLDFIKENLNEKINIYDKLKISNKQFDNLEWIFGQIKITCDYYIFGSYPPLYDVIKLYIWLKSKIKDLKACKLNKLFIRYMLIIIKRKF